MPRPGGRALFIACMALAVVAAAAATAATAADANPELVAVARALIVGVPIAVGLGAWSRHPEERFGLLLAATGAAWAVASLSELDDPVPYTLGRVAGWLAELLIVYLILSYPSGRLGEGVDRALVGAMAVVVLVFFMPRLLLAETFDVPTPYTSCVHDCPANAFLLDAEPGFVDSFLRPAGALAVLGMMVAVVLRLGVRIRDATPVGRRVLRPVLAIGAARAALLGIGFVLREVERDAAVVQVVAWSLALAVPALALAYLYRMVRWNVFAARVLECLAERLRGTTDTLSLRRALADAFDDPTAEIAFPIAGDAERWVDTSGRRLKLPDSNSGRAVSPLRDRRGVVAVVIHDEALRFDTRLVDAALSLTGVALENQRLADEAYSATSEVRQSRARVAASAERERRRIERDLHDGAQQRLVALRIELGLAEELVRRDPDEGLERLKELEHELDETLEELRALAHGVYPPLLADRGLDDALHAAAKRSPLRVELHLNGVGRYRPEVESAIYFCVLEALQNASKHAAGARHVTVRVDVDGGTGLRFSVRDDGAGAPDGAITAGAGITNMRDRLAAIGGDLDVSFTTNAGTTVRGRVPMAAQPSA